MRSIMTILAVALLISVVVHGDQQQWVPERAARAAAELMSAGTEIRHFCEPCGDEKWTSETVSTVEARSTGSEDTYEVLVNGSSIDLAYVYVQVDGKWKNAAIHLDLEVSDVSEFLADTGSDFGLAWFQGVVGEKPIMMQLTKAGADVSGTYAYAHIGAPIEVNGVTGEDDSLALTEFAEGKRTGMFVGELDLAGGAWSGKWLNTDGSRELPFEVRRIALLIEEYRSSVWGEENLEANIATPFFVEGGAGHSDALNAAIRNVVEEIWVGAVSDWTSSIAYYMNEQPESSLHLPHTLDISPAGIYHYSPALVSAALTVYTFTGGAHGMSWTLTQNLRLEDGKTAPLALSALFREDSGYLQAISNHCIAGLKKQEASNVVNGNITEFAGEDLSSFVISRAGLTVFFAPYAVGCYAEGSFEVTVPFETISPLLRPDILDALAAVPVSAEPAKG